MEQEHPATAPPTEASEPRQPEASKPGPLSQPPAVEPTAPSAPSQPDKTATDKTATSSARIERGIFVALVVLSMAGVAIADFSATTGLRYWIAVVPLFAATSLFAGWSRARRDGQGVARIVGLQVGHWAPLPLALYVVYRLERAGRLNLEDAGLFALLLLAITTLTAGVHFDRRLVFLGLLLTGATLAAALVEEFFWALLLPALVLGAALLLWQRRSEAAAPPS